MKCTAVILVYEDGSAERITGQGVDAMWHEATNHLGECEGFEGCDFETLQSPEWLARVMGDTD